MKACFIQLDTVRPNAGAAEYTVSTREYCACREEMEGVSLTEWETD